MGLRESCQIKLSIIKGEDRVHEFTFLRVTDDTANPPTTVPVDLTGSTITFTVKRWLSDSDADAVLQLDTDGNRVVLSDPTNGKFYVKAEREDFEDLASDIFNFDVQVELALSSGGYSAGDVVTPFFGTYELLDRSDDRLIFVRGDTNYFNIQVQLVTDAEATPDATQDVNLTGATCQFLAKDRVDDADADTLIGTPTFTVVSASEGKLKVTFDPADTSGIEFTGEQKRELHFQLRITLGTATNPYAIGDVIVPFSGTLTVQMDRGLTP